MDYSQLSDFEINRLVARSIDGLHGDDRTACDCYLSADTGSAIKIPDGDIGWIILDYCNNPADAWPIIIDNHIGISPYPNKAFAWSSRHGMASDLSAEDKNPLRSAMVVFLMMKDEHYA